MPYDEELDARLMDIVAPLDVDRRKMFGGTCLLLHGNMMAGVFKESLILRLGEPAAADALGEPHVRPFDITGRPMRGWVMVDPPGTDGTALADWVERARGFVESLPPK